ncbi:hypothetical protein LSCM1_06418 [Leishmania martiniquensis]|uniref:Uncharacterized protein n=1 Tax=Leishmania martiniquensis TaxID=1580590 RepID=A0A836GTS4_9TRYP|nr:hypothetical protein LSCM1_06418 [Leishmania martiniquensis]
MLGERELITLAFGNYSALVAAQWANGTSYYDACHSTLYSECCSGDVLGGGGGTTNGRVRVPRLLLLDAPYASVFDDIGAWARKYKEDAEIDEGRDPACKPSTASPAPALGGGASSSSSCRALQDSAAEEESRWLARVASAVRRRVVEQHGLSHDGSSSSSSDNEDTWDAEAVQNGEDEYAAAHLPEEELEENAEKNDGRRRGAAASRPQAHCPARLRRRLFDEHNTTVPWWQYITTGLAPNSVTSVKPLQHTDAAGDLPALHSFGYGLAYLRDRGRSGEVMDFSDALRHQLEAADQLQGVQCFTDGDGLFGGAAANVLEQLWEEAGPKTPIVNLCTFARMPQVITDVAYRADIAFRERRMDEAALNQLLATLHLSRHPSVVYIPVPMSEWDIFFEGAAAAASPTESPKWLRDDRATAQLLAAVVDTALYGLRDGSRASGASSGGPLCYMDEWCRVVRPAPSLRVAVAMGALPQPVSAASELWEFLQANPLLPGVPPLDERVTRAKDSAEADATSEKTRLQARFFSLTHSMSTYPPAHASGQVLGHAVSLRGAGRLPATVYPAREAMLRYGLPLRTSTYLPLLTEVSYPISGTFPMELLFADPSAAVKTLRRGKGGGDGDGIASLRNAVQSVDVGAHVLSTYATAPMLRGMNTKAQAALRYKMDRYCDAYVMERDDWREALEEGLALFDDYHHAPLSNAEDSSGDDYDA